MRKTIAEFCEENDIEVLFADGFDDAIIGLIRSFNEYKVLYDTDKVISILSKTMTEDEAVEYFEFNIIGSYMGENTPAFTENV
jgi:hypothetical protein